MMAMVRVVVKLVGDGDSDTAVLEMTGIGRQNLQGWGPSGTAERVIRAMVCFPLGSQSFVL